MYAASSAWYESGTVWAAAGAVAVVVVGIATMLVTYKVTTTRQKLSWAIQHTSLLSDGTSYRDLLKVSYRDQAVKAPTIVSVTLYNAGKRDIPSSSFDDERPFIVDIGVNILAKLPTNDDPLIEEGHPLPEEKVQIDGSRLAIGPWLIPARGFVHTVLLVDGTPEDVRAESSLINVDVINTTSQESFADIFRVGLSAGLSASGLFSPIVAGVVRALDGRQSRK